MSEVLVISAEADAYRPLLAARGIDAVAVDGAAAARGAYTGQAVVLGDPAPVAEALTGLDGIRWVQSTWAGVTPLLTAARGGIAVTGVKGVFGPQMAEYVLGYALAHELGVLRRHAWQRDRRWVSAPTGRLAGKTLGVLGTGSIGSKVAERAAAMGMRIVGCSRSGAERSPFERVWPVGGLGDFLAGCDYVTGLLPDTPETTGLLDAKAFSAMRDGAVLINVGRGNLVDEAALAEALQRGRPDAAVLDVFRDEPLPSDHPFWALPNLLVTAHVAARSAPPDIVGVFVENLERFRSGAPLKYRVDPERGY